MTLFLPKRLRDFGDAAPMIANLLFTDALLMLTELAGATILPWWITTSGGVDAIALFSVAIAIATFIAMPIVSPLGDRYCKATQITRGTWVLSAISLALALLSEQGSFHLGVVVALGCVQVVAIAFVDPARSSILAELVPPNMLPEAIRLRKTFQSVSGMLGPLLAGLGLSTIGVPGSLFACALLSVVAAISAARLPKAQSAEQRRDGLIHWWNELRGGLIAKWHMPMERGWTFVNFVVWIFQGPAVGMLIPIKVHSLGMSGNWLGISMGALYLGVLFGSLFGSQFLVDRFGRYRVRLGIGLLEGVALAGVGFTANPFLMVVALAVSGFCNSSMSLVGATHRALAIPKAFRIRFAAASSMTTQVAGAIGPAIAGMALYHWSVNAVYGGFGLLMATSVLGFLWVPRLREFLNLSHEQIVDWYQHQYPSIFKSSSR